MSGLKNLAGYILAQALALFAILFGGYLLYEKVYLSLITGITEERAGLIEAAQEPWIFWSWILIYGVAGTILCLGGLGLFRWLVRYALNGGDDLED